MHLLLRAKQPLKSKASLKNLDLNLCVPKQALTMLPFPADRRCGAASSSRVPCCCSCSSWSQHSACSSSTAMAAAAAARAMGG
jgi:hypothetical protein